VGHGHEVLGDLRSSRERGDAEKSMNCPNCGTEMFETNERVPYYHPFGKKKNTTKNKTILKRVFNCPQCLKKFIPALVLKEVEI